MMNDDFNDYFENDEVVEAPQPHVETEQEREDREIAEATIERHGTWLRDAGGERGQPAQDL